MTWVRQFPSALSSFYSPTQLAADILGSTFFLCLCNPSQFPRGRGGVLPLMLPCRWLPMYKMGPANRNPSEKQMKTQRGCHCALCTGKELTSVSKDFVV